MRIAVTGANGDLGSNLVPYLAGQGHTIVSIDRSLPVLQKPFSTTQHYVVDVRNFGEVIASNRLSNRRSISLDRHQAVVRSPNLKGQELHPDNSRLTCPVS